MCFWSIGFDLDWVKISGFKVVMTCDVFVFIIFNINGITSVNLESQIG